MATRASKKLKISSTIANQVRRRLLDEDTLSSRDVQILIKILDDVYPRPKRQQRWEASFVHFLIGFGIGIFLIVGVLLLLP